jgi:hypothetical protein
MNTIKKSLWLLPFFLAISIPAICQPYQKGTLSLSLGGELLASERRLSESHHTGGGATVKGEYVFGEHATATIVSGYYFMQGKNKATINYENIAAVPLKAGIRYYLGNFYGTGEAGGLFLSNFNRGTSFVYSLGMGDKIKVNNRVIDITLRHEAWVLRGNSRGLVALRVGYEFAVNQRSTATVPIY